MKHIVTAWLAAAALSACTLMPHYQRPQSPVLDRWPAHAGEAAAAASGGVSADQIGWRDFFTDPRLARLIEIALDNNRNLRIAVLNVAASQAQFRVQRGNLFPAISATGSGLGERLPANGALPLGGVAGSGGSTTKVPSGSAATTFHYYSAGIGFTNYELDLFGRQRSLTTQAFERYLAQSESRRSTQISLVAEVASDYLAVLADEALLKLTQETLRERERVLRAHEGHVPARHDDAPRPPPGGKRGRCRARQPRAVPAPARTGHPRAHPGARAGDPRGSSAREGPRAPRDCSPQVPEGLPSDLLTHRPDILSAEHALRGANANIGAARAAFFPEIQLTASGGTASGRLSGLFGSGSGTWTFAPTITLPIFNGGRNVANLDLAHIEKNVAVAQYELAIQTAFREVSDALSARGTYVNQRQAQEELVTADAEAFHLAQMRFRSGVDSYLATLDAQRSLYAAQLGLVEVRQAELANRVTLYKALGGGWQPHTASAQ